MCEYGCCDDNITYDPEEVEDNQYVEDVADREADVRVAQGIKWLDTNVGLYWRRLVDVDKLNINNVVDCVLGQIFAEYAGNPDFTYGWDYSPTEFFSGYDYAVHEWTEVQLEAGAHGFISNDLPVSTLNDAWKRALRS